MNLEAERIRLQDRIEKHKREHKEYASLVRDLMKATTRQLKRENRQARKQGRVS